MESLSLARREFRQKDGRRQTQRHGDGQRDHGCDQSAVNERRSSKVAEDRVPRRASRKTSKPNFARESCELTQSS